MPSLIASISRFVDDEPQPGIVEFVFSDASEQLHFFIEKISVVSNHNLRRTSAYPIACELACEIEAEWIDEAGNLLISLFTERPWGLVSIAGRSKFVVCASQIVR
jgi:hypothetical protein